MGRISAWVAPEGRSALVESFRDVWSAHMECPEHKGELPYTSRDMKAGIDVAGLEANAAILKPLLELDPRGGYIAQKDMFGCLEELTNEVPPFRTAIDRAAAKKGLTRKSLNVYRTRVQVLLTFFESDFVS